ncbi:M10 family metallopeptidase [Kamptonema formosum]|uniref:M10 family metallopeptidase n=1 Tax=Kamptonema formosum TaxID=331992 RepID=UPI0003453D3E|nr:M10 family metallopeptidase [Oscillatoria sp. PCC 10802]
MATAVGIPTPPKSLPLDIVDLNLYRISNPDLAGLNDDQLLSHLETYGLAEGRLFSLYVDLPYYRENNSDQDTISDRDLLIDFQQDVIFQGRDPSPFFDFTYYLEHNQDVADAASQYALDSLVSDTLTGGSSSSGTGTLEEQILQSEYEFAFNHYMTNGLAEGRKASRFFDANYYRINNPDLVAAGLNNKQLFEHYLISGLDEGRRASPVFDPSYYLNTNRDLRAAGLSNRQAFEHYVTFGQTEGRRPSLFLDREAISSLVFPGSPSFFGDAQATTSTTGQTTGTTATDTTQTASAQVWDVSAGGTLTYSFVTTASAFLYPGEESGVGEVSDAIKNNVRQIMQKYDEILPFNIVEVPDRPPSEGQIRIMFSNGDGSNNFYAYAYQPPQESSGVSQQIAGDVHLSRDYETDPNEAFSSGPGSFGYEALIHEIGHALGLKHPYDYSNSTQSDANQQAVEVGPFLSAAKDNDTNTVMSYNFAGVGAKSPMAFDVRALQDLYGMSDFNSTDTTYTFDIGTFFDVKQSIWDAAGADTLDFAALPATDSYYFDMNEGGRNTTTSALNGATYTVTEQVGTQNSQPVYATKTYTTDIYATVIAFGTTIENLVGSQGNDAILGNPVANRIDGGAGADKITGAVGADTLTGGAGADIFAYSPGDGGLSQPAGDIITDFTPGEDAIGLGSGLAFKDILIEAAGADTALRLAGTGEYLATLIGIQAPTLTAADFTQI